MNFPEYDQDYFNRLRASIKASPKGRPGPNGTWVSFQEILGVDIRMLRGIANQIEKILEEESEPNYKEQAECTEACFLHLVGMVERGETEEAKGYAKYVREVRRLEKLVEESE